MCKVAFPLFPGVTILADSIHVWVMDSQSELDWKVYQHHWGFAIYEKIAPILTYPITLILSFINRHLGSWITMERSSCISLWWRARLSEEITRLRIGAKLSTRWDFTQSGTSPQISLSQSILALFAVKFVAFSKSVLVHQRNKLMDVDITCTLLKHE